MDRERTHHPTSRFALSLPEAVLHKAVAGIMLPWLLNKETGFPESSLCAAGLLSCRQMKEAGVSVQRGLFLMRVVP